MNRFSVYVPIRIESVANLREHWTVKARRVKRERNAVAMVMRTNLQGRAFPLPCIVTMTRIAPRSLDDDNLSGGMKAVRDQIAEEMHVDDADPRVVWLCGQEKAARMEYALRITIEAPP